MSQYQPQPTNPPEESKQRGFTFAEKWIIWTVFCLLIALSTNFLLFPVLQLLSWGVVRWRWYKKEKIPFFKRGLAVLAVIAGAVLLAWVIALR